MKNINPFFLATGLVFLVCGYAWAGGSIEFLGNFSGGTVGAPTVFTGDNSGGTGTVRIRPSDNDTQLTLCAADNNLSPEVCSTLQHDNFTSTDIYSFWTINGYVDSPGSGQRFNTTQGRAGLFMRSSSTNASNGVVASAGNVSGGAMVNLFSGYLDSGGTTATLTVPSSTTLDSQKAITNSGSATCNGYNAGYVCFTDDVAMVGSTAMNFYIGGNSATGYGNLVFQDNSGTAKAGFGYANASYTDADVAGKFYVNALGVLEQFGRTDDVASGTAAFAWMDNITNTGVLLADIDGAGRIRPLLYGSQTDCTDNAGAAACGAAPTGAVVLDDGSTTVVVSTTAVTANSTISVNFDPSLGTKLGITCNTTQTFPYVSARTAATSFTITSADPAGANKVCVSYSIIN